VTVSRTVLTSSRRGGDAFFKYRIGLGQGRNLGSLNLRSFMPFEGGHDSLGCLRFHPYHDETVDQTNHEQQDRNFGYAVEGCRGRLEKSQIGASMTMAPMAGKT
jgi:hypothetical protein